MATPTNHVKGVVQGEFGEDVVLTLLDRNGNSVDVSTYIGTKTAVCISPSGKRVTSTVTFVAAGADGQVKWQFADGDVNEPGEWLGQVELLKTGARAKSKVFEMPVEPSLSATT